MFQRGEEYGKAKIDRWEDGFFEQFEKNLEQLLEPVKIWANRLTGKIDLMISD